MLLRRAVLALLVLPVLAAAASSCAAPLQSGGVTVHPGADARLGMMCRYGGQGQKVCAVLEEGE